jgi:hypothetical protein
MDPELISIIDAATRFLPLIVAIVAIVVAGSLLNTWLRIKNGYPLQSSWGTAMHPRSDKESMERIKLLTSENAQLRAELGSVKDRLETIERIVTDQPGRLAQEIDRLAIDKGGRA